jgi:hypothetical protein
MIEDLDDEIEYDHTEHFKIKNVIEYIWERASTLSIEERLFLSRMYQGCLAAETRRELLGARHVLLMVSREDQETIVALTARCT